MGPVGVAFLALALLLGVGYVVRYGWPFSQETSAPVVADDGQKGVPVAEPKATPAPEPQAPTPEPPKADTPQAIRAARSHIDRSNGAAETKLLTVYYGDGLENGDTLQPVQIRVASPESILKTVVAHLLNPPAELKLYNSVPAGTAFRSINFDASSGIATVDLTREILNVQGSAAAETVRDAFVLSLTEIEGVNAVQLWAMGYPVTLHGIEWDKPLTRGDLQAHSNMKVAPVIQFANP